MLLTELNPVIELDSLIEVLTFDLHRYENSEKVKRLYVEKQVKLIEKLKSISCTLDFYKNHGLLLTIQNEINKINQVDNEVENYIIHVFKNKESLRTALIVINL